MHLTINFVPIWVKHSNSQLKVAKEISSTLFLTKKVSDSNYNQSGYNQTEVSTKINNQPEDDNQGNKPHHTEGELDCGTADRLQVSFLEHALHTRT